MTEASGQRTRAWIPVFLFVLLIAIFLKNAWVCDDAYIIFRSIEQLFAGNGPNWNPHERVQAYTSPLWFWILAGARVFSADHFFNTILVSLVMFLLLGAVVHRYFRNNSGLVFLLAAVAGSSAFFDFTTSGLENILCYLITAVAILSGFASLKESGAGSGRRHYKRALLAFALLPLCRHDLIPMMILPALALITMQNGRTPGERLVDCLLIGVPLMLWSAFSLIYYGAIFPNTAYAKILTGISRYELGIQGLTYLWVTFYRDPVTILVVLAAITGAWSSGNLFSRALACGLGMQLFYVVWAGGDFMRGRFLAVPFLAAVLLVVETGFSERFLAARPSLKRFLPLGFAVFLVLFPYTPVNTGLGYQDFSLNHGIADERGYYFDVCSLYAYLYSKPGELFPDFEWSQIGRQIAVSGVNYLENDFNGMLGYWAGTRPVIIDRLALTDPLLARRPVQDTKAWRIGHFKRLVPEEYRRSLATAANCFKDQRAAALYDMILMATREKEIWSTRRVMAILKLNLGLY